VAKPNIFDMATVEFSFKSVLVFQQTQRNDD